MELPDRDFLRRVFLMEAWETLASLEDAMQRITDVPGDADETLTLVTHRLKGAAALNGFATLAEVAGQAEEMVERLPGAPLDERRRTIEFMRAFVAALRPALDRIEATGREDADALAALLPPPATADGSDARSELVAPAPQPLAEMERFLAENPEVLEYFGPEAAEHLETISRTLTSLEQQPTEDEMKTLFRAVHTLKGAAYTVGCNVVGDLAHRIEDLLGAIRDGRAALTPDVFETVWIGHDALKVLLAGGQAPPNGNDVVARAVERLMGGGQAAGIPPAAPASVAAIPAISARPLGAPARAASPRTPHDTGGRIPGANVRVSLERLDSLMNLVGELVIARSRLDRRLGQLERVGELLAFSRGRMAHAVEQFEKKHNFPTLRAAAAPADATPIAAIFGDLEFDRYDDVNVLARGVAEISADVSEVHAQLGALIRAVREDTGHVQRISAELREQVTRIRLVPIGRLFTRFGRRVSELAKSEGKAVTLTTAGESVEVDTLIIEQLADPITHLIRNAIAHGIEPEEERRGRGKPPVGTIALTAYHQGGWIGVEVEDDGRGIDAAALRREAEHHGFVDADAARALSDRDALDLIFLPGFSTADHISTTAGRGVGMDVVRANVTQLGGEIEVETELGVGTRFTLRVPLTVAISDALLVRAGGEPFAIPLSAVQSLVSLQPDEIRKAARGDVIMVGEQALDLIPLDRALGLPKSATTGRIPVAVLRTGRRSVAVAVDELVGKTDVVIKNLGGLLEDAAPFAGATITGEGGVILLLDPGRLMDRWNGVESSAARAHRPADVAEPVLQGGRVLLVDDSVSVRRFVAQMLTRGGFTVTTASDGADALERVAAASFDIIVTDLEMPRVNGYELIKALRRRPATREVPIVVLTTRVGDKHLTLARELGAAQCVSKPVDEHGFVRLLRSLVKTPATADGIEVAR